MTLNIMTVDLSHEPNPDVDGGYWSPPIDRGTTHCVRALSLTDASQQCRQYIDHNGLGGGNWTGGTICIDGEPVGRVSYNGRVWSLDDETTLTEAELVTQT